MGYTHYWDNPGFTDEQWTSAVTDIKKVLNHALPIVETPDGEVEVHLTGCYSYKNPVFSKAKIYFNGGNGGNRVKNTEGYWEDEEDSGLNHETFSIPKKVTKDNAWNFCKTARKPYDFAVCVSLILLNHYNPNFTYSSDGYEDEEYWPVAKDYINKVLNKNVKVKFK